MKNISIAQQYGIIAGIVTILYMLLFYFWGKRLLNPEIYGSSLLIYAGAMVLGGLKLRSKNDGVLSFQEGLRNCFVIFLVANFLYYIFYYLLFKYDPSLVDIQNELYRSYIGGLAEPGKTAEEIESVKNARIDITLGTIIFTYAKGAIGGFMMSVVLTYLIKRP